MYSDYERNEIWRCGIKEKGGRSFLKEERRKENDEAEAQRHNYSQEQKISPKKISLPRKDHATIPSSVFVFSFPSWNHYV